MHDEEEHGAKRREIVQQQRTHTSRDIVLQLKV